MDTRGGWEGVRSAVRERIGGSAFDAWIDPLSGSVEGEALILRCPDRFTRDWVRARYDGLLREIVSHQAGGGRIDYRVEPLSAPSRAALPPPAAPGRVGGPKSPRSSREGSMSFDGFVAGPTNALALEGARAIARGDIGRLSPLVITGPSGVGKTHLCRAIRDQSSGNVVYRSSEEFTAEVTSAIRSREMERVRHRYRRSANVLIIEDIHFLEGRRATQVELFHTLDHLLAQHRPVVLSCDRPPHELSGLETGLRSRLGQGLVAQIAPPDAETRLRILRERAAAGGIRVPDDCIEMLAAQPVRSVRDLLAGLNQVVARATLLRQAITRRVVADAIQAVGIAGASRSIDEILLLVEGAFKVSREQLLSRSKRQHLVRPRQLAMYLCRRCSDASLKEIGRAFARDHTSVLYAVRVVEKRITERPQLRYELEALASRIGTSQVS